ncbi:MAG TPA: bifunctional 5,10-methylenetetrahydrofolate dehydrogenase/5,10-methenyltetrahydrofolate cyclohydrolase [Bdellovibrionales bacterium]|nr:bifunctional 5,10-methylenetetrahydrofolate dehydrogenase/5,10-methenyltetrahydrofolate cyclohydrolase [Bdellovibrionales bacterium]
MNQMLRLDGTVVAQERKAALIKRTADFLKRTGRKPGLAVVIVGSDPASQVYVRNKVKTTGEVGMQSFHFELPETTSESEIIAKVKSLNTNPEVDGILVQLPLPKGIGADRVTEAILPEKDPDGLTTGNLGLLLAGKKRVAPCTPFGVMAILEHYKIPVKGRRAVVIGRSSIVGKPMAQLLLEADATVTMCHSRTADLFHHTRDAEIVVVAAGKPRFLGGDAFAKGSTVIDVGIHRPTEGPFAGKLCGDVRYEELGHVAAATPVPKGVGPMTIQMLMENTLHLAELREGART